MAPTPSPRVGKSGYLQFTVMIALAALLLPLMFGQTITISPLVLFAVAVMPNFLVYLIREKEGGGSGMFSRVFFLRVAASGVCALLLYGIYLIAYTLGA